MRLHEQAIDLVEITASARNCLRLARSGGRAFVTMPVRVPLASASLNRCNSPPLPTAAKIHVPKIVKELNNLG